MFFSSSAVVFCSDDIANVTPTQLVSESKQLIESSTDGKWIVNHPNSRKIYGIQCGLDVTLFTLKYFKVNYSLLRVSLGLPLSEEGIALTEIQKMLTAHGLEIDARKNVTLKQIASRLDGEHIVILPLSAGNGRNHYYIGMMDDQGDVQLVNVSKGISPLVTRDSQNYNVRLEKLFEDAGGIVLFIKKGKVNSASISSVVDIQPETIELGEFMVGGSEVSNNIRASFYLINQSTKPVMVSSVQTSCGCTKLDWDGGILKAGEKKEIIFSVIPGAWGRGEQEKIARVSFFDGSTKDVRIHGTGQTPVERQRIELSQYSVSIEIRDDTNHESFDVRLAKLSSYIYPINDLTIASNVSWLIPRTIKQDTIFERENAELYVTIATKDLLPLLEESEGKLQGVLHISGNSDMEPVELKVEVFQVDFYHLSQYLVTLSETDSVVTVSVIPETEGDSIKILHVDSEVDFIVVSPKQTDDVVALTLSLDGEKTIRPGFYTVSAKIVNSQGRSSTAKITTRVVKTTENIVR